MKKGILGILSIILIGSTYAADLEATVIDSDPGDGNGEIDLDITGGASPFIFDWVGPDGFTSSDEDLSGLEPGVYTVSVTDHYCGIAVLEVVVDELSQVSLFEEEELFELSIYPNPTSGLIYLSSTEQLDIIVFNVLGEQVWSGQNVTEIDLTEKERGIYMIQASSEKGVLTRKVTLQ